jgi:hypothetical protein
VRRLSDLGWTCWKSDTNGGQVGCHKGFLTLLSTCVIQGGTALTPISMAYYGIPSAGLVLTASTANDTVAMANLGGTTVTAASVYGADGNDIISLGAVGLTAVASGTYTHVDGSGGTGNVTATLIGSASYSNQASGLVDSGTTLSVHVTGVVTSQQGARIVNGALFQSNAGNDSIVLGDKLSRVSASTFAGGAGNDVIGGYTNVNNVWTATTVSGATFISSDIEGGNGNDTVYLRGSAAYSAIDINANKGNDLVDFQSAVVSKSIIGLGAGNDELSGQFESITTGTVAGGKGNDTIQLNSTTNSYVVVGGDRAGNVNTDGDGNDSIFIMGSLTASTVYGGGGNDSITWSGDAGSGNLVSMNQGADVFTANDGSLLNNSTVALGNQGDLFRVQGTATITTSTINMGKGLDTFSLSSIDVSTGSYAGSTINGGAGADFLLGSASLNNGDTVAFTLGYATASDSTITAFDTIGVGIAAAQSGDYKFNYAPGGAVGGTFSGAGVTSTNGVVTFTSTYENGVTARASAISTEASTGDAAVFIDGSGINYLFVKGATDNLVVQVGTASISGGLNDAGLSIAAGKTITLSLG